MKQLGLGSEHVDQEDKKTRKREFLEKMEHVVPWRAGNARCPSRIITFGKVDLQPTIYAQIQARMTTAQAAKSEIKRRDDQVDVRRPPSEAERAAAWSTAAPLVPRVLEPNPAAASLRNGDSGLDDEKPEHQPSADRPIGPR